MKKIYCVLLALLTAIPLYPQTIAEKKESFSRQTQEMDDVTREQLREVNRELEERRCQIGELYTEALSLYQTGADERAFKPLLDEIRFLKKEIAEIHQMWRTETANLMQNEEYALWHQPEASLHQLIADYGAPDFVYLIPPEICNVRISLNSNLPIPREAWSECLELILGQYGIAIRPLNGFIRELYVLRNDPSSIKGILDSQKQLDLYAPTVRVCYVLTPTTTDPRTDSAFLQRFSNPVTTRIEILHGKIFITATVASIQELLKLYAFTNAAEKRQDFQLVTLTKINAREMETILTSAFYDTSVMGINVEGGASLRVIPLENLSHSLFISGSVDEVKKAIALIRDVEGQIEDPEEKTVFWYTVKHSDPEELATVLAKVYDLLINVPAKGGKPVLGAVKKEEGRKDEGMAVPAINIKPHSSQRSSHKTADGQNNFIVDPKTSSIIMVVEADALPKIKELLKKLDVPKKMVQIEVLLFEKKVSNSNNFGLNLLRLGDGAKNLAKTGLAWGAGGGGPGILEFLISRNKGSGIPAYDLAYQFMLGQDDVQINASPSVTTMNQTPATIAIVEEVSIDSGEGEKKNRIFTRAQYGITIQITPIINMDDTLHEEGFVTLETDITFDTPKKNQNDRPDVTRRHIKNQVRIADGQTVILGGLRRKQSQDTKDSIPFLGEIPGLGKLFSHTDMHDDSTEMFVFITPKIIADPVQDAERIKREELKKRPGDIPEFLHELAGAQARERERLFEGSLTMLFGKGHPASIANKREGEYDGH